MRLINVLAATLIGVTVILVQPQNTAALDGGEINNIAKQITVKIEGKNKGTGVIVKKEGNTYTVLTNHHVVREQGKYILITPNGKTYNFNSSNIRQLPNLDLAVVQFTSNDNYTVATLGDSNELKQSTEIYNFGWAVNDTICFKGCDRFYNGIINGIAPNPDEGYALIISNNTLPGMSGGPILNSQGTLVGINGLSVKNVLSGAVEFKGIPINKYKNSPSPQPGKEGLLQNLNLTAEQKAKIQEIQRNYTAQIEAVLTTEQKNQLKAARQRKQGQDQEKQWVQLNLTQAQKYQINQIRESSKRQIDAVLTPLQLHQLKHP
jgi:hypothetical protein